MSMGLLGLVKVAKGLVPSFLHVGAILTVIGGLFACCYNCRWYNAIGDARRGYKSMEYFLASSAMASGIFGVFAAIAAIAAVALSFTGLSNTIVTIVYAVTLVLYLGEMIPEAVLIGQGALFSTGDARLRKDRDWIYMDEDFWYFCGEGKTKQQEFMPPAADTIKLALATKIRNGNGFAGFSSAVSYALDDGGWKPFSFSSLPLTVNSPPSRSVIT